MALHSRDYRKIFLLASILLTIFGCIVSVFSLGLVRWQYVDIKELSTIHDHGIFMDCISSGIAPLDQVRLNEARSRYGENPNRWNRKCVFKSDLTAQTVIRQAVSAADPGSREFLLHRFLPQHKAVIFFTVFTVLFAIISIIIGGCSSCFVPNSVLHVIAVIITLLCSLFGDIMFFLASMRIDNRAVPGVVGSYPQNLGYAFYLHLSAVLIFFFALLCSFAAAYMLIRKDYRQNGCCNDKNPDTMRLSAHENGRGMNPSTGLDDYPPVPKYQTPPFQPAMRPGTTTTFMPGRPAALVYENNHENGNTGDPRWDRRGSYDRSLSLV
uniref:Clc-like protein n=1 Tax=Panagrellus redivivus TaxID=6233 RepID=A0A7E4UT13_PANRE